MIDHGTDEGIIPTAINIPLPGLLTAMDMKPEEFEEKYGHSLPDCDDDNIVLVCKAGVRSSMAMNALVELRGYTRVRHYPGGNDEWQYYTTMQNK